MRTPAASLVTAALALLAPAARAQEAPPPTVVRDEWTARFRGARKAGWERSRIEERPGAGFVVTEEGAELVPDGGVRTTTRREVDAGGRVTRFARTITAPWGTTTAEAEARAEGGLRYRVQVRSLPAREGTLEDCWDPAVTALLVLRGAQPPGRRTLRCLELPGDGSKDRTLDVAREGDRWRITRDRAKEWRARDGAFVRGEPEDRADEVLLPATEADAADAKVAAGDRPAALEHVVEGSLRVRRPGPEWSLARRAGDGQEPTLLGAEHPSGAGVFVIVLPMRLPVDARERTRLAGTLRGSINAQREKSPTGDGPELGEPALATWNDLPAARFSLGGRSGQAPMVGDVVLVGLPEGASALIVVAAAEDLAEARAADLQAARDAVALATAAEAPWERVTLGSVSLELPRAWKRQGPRPHMASAMGASQVNVTTDRLPEGFDLRRAQDLWVERQRGNPAIEAVEVERAEDAASVDGRPAYLTLVRGKLRETNGVAPAMRAASCAIAREDGTFVEVTVVAFDLDWDLAAVDRVLGSVRWLEEH